MTNFKSLNYVMLFMISLLLLMACGGESSSGTSDVSSTLEKTLLSNTSWPVKLLGTLDIVEAGGYGESEYPNWAVGSFITSDDDYGVSIKIGEGVVENDNIDIDSGEEVYVWLSSPVKEYGVQTFPVVKIESL